MPLTRHVYNYFDLWPADRDAITALVRELGLDPSSVAVDFAACVSDGHHQLHLTEYLRNALGDFYLVDGATWPASRPWVFDVTPERLPAVIRPTDERKSSR